jgi:hypothetical protein
VSSLVGTVAAGCGGGSAPVASLTITVDSSGPTRVIRIAGEPPVWRLDSLARIGSLDVGPQAFNRVRSLLLDAAGRVYVVDNGNRAVLVFGPDGEFERQLGREGAGPGEYRDPYSLAWLGDTLALLDPRNARLALFLRDGSWAGSWRASVITGAPSLVRLYRMGTAGFASFDLQRTEGPSERVFVRWSARTPAGDTVPFLMGPQAAGVQCASAGLGIGFYSNPFSPRLVQTPAPDGTIAAAVTDRFRLAFITPAGDTVRIIERATDPPRLTDDDWRPVDSSFRAFREQWRGATCTPAGLDRPTHRPALRDLFYDHDDRLWVEVAVPGGFRFEVFDAGGRLLGALPAPPRLPSVEPSVVAGRLAVVEADNLGVQYVRIFRISP